MAKTNRISAEISDSAIVSEIGQFIKHTRSQKNITQANLAEMAGLNRYTLSQIETGESITLSSLIQILRALDSLYVLKEFEVNDEISPLEYAKLKKKEKERVRTKETKNEKKEDLGW
ncbi:helix-turn-helix domain-containing protein [Cyclobacterium xiamenense]|uniref:helix-turn-helix domain-containing protein n=1 Tax=Cyclobacterium xiamenense TaxID=1297121 RepID=UPI0012B9DF33|nr:helix-turn-helix transcriptional regulator [Cyclobacterium xiamenense]